MEHLPIITTTTGLISNALSSIKSARKLAKTISDNELKEQIGAAYETLLDLREHALKLDEENRLLKTQLAEKAAYVGPVAPHGYFHAASDVHTWNKGLRRECKLCREANGLIVGSFY